MGRHSPELIQFECWTKFSSAPSVMENTNTKRGLGAVFLVLLLAAVSICNATSHLLPISDSHRSAALELFLPVDGSFGRLEESYKALRTLEVLGIEKKL